VASLLERLTDDDPTSSNEGSFDRRATTAAELRESVRHDLTHLFNATQLAAVRDLGAYPEVERSTLNFGVPDLTGRSASSIDPADVARRVRRALLAFEPRLVESSLKVHASLSREQCGPNALRFDIEGDLRSQPSPIHLHLRADLSLEDGEAQVFELAR
jgi:type VI secretion system protein ImpF